MPKFGYEEVITTLDFDHAKAEKTKYLFSEAKSHVVKDTESFHVNGEAEALGHIIPALKKLTSGESHFVCAEVFTDSNGITRIQISHMHETI